MIVTVLGGFAEGVYETVHTPDDNVQEAGVNVPPAPPSLHDTEPVGVMAEIEVSATVALNVTGPPEDAVAGFGATDRVEV